MEHKLTRRGRNNAAFASPPLGLPAGSKMNAQYFVVVCVNVAITLRPGPSTEEAELRSANTCYVVATGQQRQHSRALGTIDDTILIHGFLNIFSRSVRVVRAFLWGFVGRSSALFTRPAPAAQTLSMRLWADIHGTLAVMTVEPLRRPDGHLGGELAVEMDKSRAIDGADCLFRKGHAALRWKVQLRTEADADGFPKAAQAKEASASWDGHLSWFKTNEACPVSWRELIPGIWHRRFSKGGKSLPGRQGDLEIHILHIRVLETLSSDILITHNERQDEVSFVFVAKRESKPNSFGQFSIRQVVEVSFRNCRVSTNEVDQVRMDRIGGDVSPHDEGISAISYRSSWVCRILGGKNGLSPVERVA